MTRAVLADFMCASPGWGWDAVRVGGRRRFQGTVERGSTQLSSTTGFAAAGQARQAPNRVLFWPLATCLRYSESPVYGSGGSHGARDAARRGRGRTDQPTLFNCPPSTA